MKKTERFDSTRKIHAPRGARLTAKSWATEAALRMLMNNLDEEVAESPQSLVVYGGMGRAARNWACYDKIIEVLTELENDQTLLIQSGKPVGVFRTHFFAPRVLIANSNLVPAWANWDTFNRLDKAGLMMYGQMTAGSWIYIGSQGIIQGTYETFCEAAKQHFDGKWTKKWILTAGLGGMGGAQPLAATMAGACILAIEVDKTRIDKRLKTGYLDTVASSLKEALQLIEQALEKNQTISVALCANAATILPELVRLGVCPDLVTDQTSAHDPLNGYYPPQWSLAQCQDLRKTSPDTVIKEAKKAMATHVEAMLEFQKMGAIVFDYGNNIRQMAFDEGVTQAFDIPGFVPMYIRPQFCIGRGPFRWVALSGLEEDIFETDKIVQEVLPRNEHLHQWLRHAKNIAFQGLPARIAWLALGERAKVGLAFNQAVASGRLKAPIVIGRDHLDSGSVASPRRETEGMKDGSDAVSDWPILNALLNCASGASWVSFHHGGGVGMGYSQHAGFVVVADGTSDAAQRLELVLTNDPATGVMRHADAGYSDALQMAKQQQLNLPMVDFDHEDNHA